MTNSDVQKIRVPATSANLGPGYDCLGLALDMWVELSASLSDSDHFLYSGEGELPDTRHNLTHQGFASVYRELGLEAPPVTFTVHNPIPLARGLGSSSAALVSGAVAADMFTGNQLGRDGVFQICARAEGHPDNVAPAVYGGFTVSARAGEDYVCRSLPLPHDWHFLVAIPDFELPTITARKVVPESFARADVISTSSRTALWALAVATGDAGLLDTATRDVLHQPYREPLLPGFTSAAQSAREAGAWAAFLSGAGPSLAVVCPADRTEAVTTALSAYGRVIELAGAGGFEVI